MYEPGTFSWIDLNTTDQGAAKAFYVGLFGWEVEDMPVGDGVFYSMVSIGSKRVAAISPQPEQQRAAGVPPMWNSYITVTDADAVADSAKLLGATVHAPPFDVMQAGRMAVIQDPQGAFFELWQPREHAGAALVNAPGSLCWNELASSDAEASATFYRDLFGWTITALEDSPIPYLIIHNGEATNGAISQPEPTGAPPHWLVYFAVADVEPALAKVAALGGAKLAEPFDMGIGHTVIVRDPQGAAFALYAGRLDS
jgi:predicted enzyme related to lactoylglutathione lyase